MPGRGRQLLWSARLQTANQVPETSAAAAGGGTHPVAGGGYHRIRGGAGVGGSAGEAVTF